MGIHVKQKKKVKWDSVKSNIHVFYGLLLDPHARGNLGENTLLLLYPYDFLIVTITCAWLLLRLLTVYGFRLSTQVQIFFSPHLRGNIKDCLWGLAADGPMICSPRTPHWNICTFPSSLPSFSLPCILSFLLPTSKTQLPESRKTSVLTKNTGMPLRSFKGDFSGIGDSTETPLMSCWILWHVLNRQTQRGGIFAWQFQTSPQTSDTWFTETMD